MDYAVPLEILAAKYQTCSSGTVIGLDSYIRVYQACRIHEEKELG
jgi:hypothetical protein